MSKEEHGNNDSGVKTKIEFFEGKQKKKTDDLKANLESEDLDLNTIYKTPDEKFNEKNLLPAEKLDDIQKTFKQKPNAQDMNAGTANYTLKNKGFETKSKGVKIPVDKTANLPDFGEIYPKVNEDFIQNNILSEDILKKLKASKTISKNSNEHTADKLVRTPAYNAAKPKSNMPTPRGRGNRNNSSAAPATELDKSVPSHLPSSSIKSALIRSESGYTSTDSINSADDSTNLQTKNSSKTNNESKVSGLEISNYFNNTERRSTLAEPTASSSNKQTQKKGNGRKTDGGRWK